MDWDTVRGPNTLNGDVSFCGPQQMPGELGKPVLRAKLANSHPNLIGHNLSASLQQSQSHELIVQIE